MTSPRFPPMRQTCSGCRYYTAYLPKSRRLGRTHGGDADQSPACIYIYIYIYIYICTSVCVCVYIYIYIYTYP